MTHGVAFDVAHMLAGGLVLVSFAMLYQDRLYALIYVLALHALIRDSGMHKTYLGLVSGSWQLGAKRIDELSKRLAVLEAENAALREKLDLPPKTPDNSSTPPSQGRKASSEPTRKPKGKAHAGAYRPLHPNPTRHRDVPAAQCQHCGTNVAAEPQVACEESRHLNISRGYGG